MLVMSQDGKEIVETTGKHFKVLNCDDLILVPQIGIWVVAFDDGDVTVFLASYDTEDRAVAKLNEMLLNYDAGAKTYRFPEERKVVDNGAGRKH